MRTVEVPLKAHRLSPGKHSVWVMAQLPSRFKGIRAVKKPERFEFDQIRIGPVEQIRPVMNSYPIDFLDPAQFAMAEFDACRADCAVTIDLIVSDGEIADFDAIAIFELL